MNDLMSIAELADAAGLSRRAIRYYVQQGLLPAPLGGGRGSHYDASHLERLKRVAELQTAGHSLDGIRRLLDGKPVPQPPPPRPAAAAKFAARLWTRVRLGDGLELSLDATRYRPSGEQLEEVSRAVRKILGYEGQD